MIDTLRDLLNRGDADRLDMAQLAIAAAGNRLQRLLDSAMREAPLGRQQLAGLGDGILAIEVIAPTLALHLAVADGRLQLHLSRAESARATLTGSAQALAALLSSGEQHSFAGSGVTAAGDLVWLGQFNTVLANLDIDWGGVLAGQFGDLAGQLIADGAQAAWQHGRRTAHRTAHLAVEVTQQEWQLLPSRRRLARLNSELTELRRGVDRLQAKLDYTLRQRQRQRQSQQSEPTP